MATVTRQRAHTRHIHMEGFHRSDGLGAFYGPVVARIYPEFAGWN